MSTMDEQRDRHEVQDQDEQVARDAQEARDPKPAPDGSEAAGGAGEKGAEAEAAAVGLVDEFQRFGSRLVAAVVAAANTDEANAFRREVREGIDRLRADLDEGVRSWRGRGEGEPGDEAVPGPDAEADSPAEASEVGEASSDVARDAAPAGTRPGESARQAVDSGVAAARTGLARVLRELTQALDRAAASLDEPRQGARDAAQGDAPEPEAAGGEEAREPAGAVPIDEDGVTRA